MPKKLTKKNPKKTKYSLQTKIKAILLREKGHSAPDIVKRLQLKSHRQVYQWCQWFKNHEFQRLQQPLGKTYTQQANNPTKHHQQQIIKAEIKQKLKHTPHKNQAFYLALIEEYKAFFHLNHFLQWLKIPASSYYRWLKKSWKPKPLTTNEKKILSLCHQNKQKITTKSYFIYGHRKIHFLLQQQKSFLSLSSVYQTMKKFNLLAETTSNAYKKKTTLEINNIPRNQRKNLLASYLNPKQPLRTLTTDITALPAGFYLACVMDLYNREIVSYEISRKPDLKLVLKMLNNLPFTPHALLHSDQGAVFISNVFHQAAQAKNLTQSFSNPGRPDQNIHIEVFFSHFKAETFKLAPNQPFSFKTIKKIIKNYLTFYNHQRIMRLLNYQSPQTFKANQQKIAIIRHKYYQLKK